MAKKYPAHWPYYHRITIKIPDAIFPDGTTGMLRNAVDVVSYPQTTEGDQQAMERARPILERWALEEPRKLATVPSLENVEYVVEHLMFWGDEDDG